MQMFIRFAPFSIDPQWVYAPEYPKSVFKFDPGEPISRDCPYAASACPYFNVTTSTGLAPAAAGR